MLCLTDVTVALEMSEDKLKLLRHKYFLVLLKWGSRPDLRQNSFIKKQSSRAGGRLSSGLSGRKWSGRSSRDCCFLSPNLSGNTWSRMESMGLGLWKVSPGSQPKLVLSNHEQKHTFGKRATCHAYIRKAASCKEMAVPCEWEPKIKPQSTLASFYLCM